MAEEKKEVESSEEDEKKSESEQEEEKKSEEEGTEGEDKFAKDGELVPASKHNQALRKAREAEKRERDLKKELEDLKSSKTEKKEDDEEEEDDGSFVEDIEYEDGEKKKKSSPDTSKLIDEKMKPVLERLNQREENDRKLARTAFFEAHPEYLSNGEKFQELLDEMDNSINPNSKDDYYTQLEKAHRILAGETYDAVVENKKKEMANDAASGGDGAEKEHLKEEFTAEDRKYMKEFNVSEEGMRAYKKKIESGEMQIMS